MRQKRRQFLIALVFGLFMVDNFVTRDVAGATDTQAGVKVKFRVRWDGQVIPGITKVSNLKRNTTVLSHRGGGEANLFRRSPGETKYQPIILQRPRTYDKEFEQWANKVFNFGSGLGSEVSLKDFRKDLIIEITDEAGRVLLAFKVYRCWPSEYVALSDLDLNDDKDAMETLTLEHEGWERDYEVR